MAIPAAGFSANEPCRAGGAAHQVPSVPSCVCATWIWNLERGNPALCLGTCGIPAFPWLSCSNVDFVSFMGLSRFIWEFNSREPCGTRRNSWEGIHLPPSPCHGLSHTPAVLLTGKHPQRFGFLWEYLFWRAGLSSTGVDEPTLGKFLPHLSLPGEGKPHISIKVSADICGPSRILSGAGQNLCLLIAPGSEGKADI